ncbi:MULTISPECIES: hypothetical protein [Halorussus]|uniref:DUF7504 family protein n=1 Tax=Halorussus TaxID=1070314 RepID=UPI000E2105E4|nr:MULTISPECIES: hypothetical protein [Halorussus]NHN59078.1 hypothetical protein [Halorussus sp. JP-T4]
MSPGSSGRGDDGSGGDGAPSDEEPRFLDVLRELKADGCNLLVVGDAPRRLFTAASAGLLGGTDEIRYRLLAITDASSRSVVERLPGPEAVPGSLADTTEVVNHAGPPRSAAEAGGRPEAPPLADISEPQVADPQLAGLQADLAEAMAEFDCRAGGLDPGQLRVGVDSVGALVERYDEDVVRRCLRVVTGYVRDYDAMGHYVLTEPYGSDRADRLADEFDAVVEIRAVDAAGGDHHAEERWHVPSHDLTTDWLPL